MQAQDYSGANAGGSHFFQPNQANFAPAAGADQMQQQMQSMGQQMPQPQPFYQAQRLAGE